MSDESINNEDYLKLRMMAVNSLRGGFHHPCVMRNIKFDISDQIKEIVKEERIRVQKALIP